MSLLSSFARRAVDASEFGTVDEGWGSVADSGVEVSSKSAMRLIAVYACVTLISDAIRAMPVDLFRKRNGSREEVDRRPMWLEQPNQEQSWSEFIDLGMHSLLTNGNLFIWLGVRDENQLPEELIFLHPDDVQVVVRRVMGQKQILVAGKPMEQYTLRNPTGQILHIMGHTADGLIGLSPIEKAKQAIGLGLAAEKYGAKFFGQGSQSSGILQLPPGASPKPEDLKLLSAEFRRKYSGVDNAWKPIVLANGATYAPISIPNDSAQFIESRKFSVDEIARLYRVPPHLIGDVERSTSWGTGIEQQGIGFVTYTLMPWLTRLEAAFSQLTPRGQYIRFNTNALLRGDSKARFEAYSLGIQNGFITRNEVRALEDLPPIDGLDQVLTPLNMTEEGASV